MTDRELLELAAKAAGREFDPTVKAAHGLMVVRDGAVCQSDQVLWNPLADDGDALRLAVKLGLLVDCDDVLCDVEVVMVMRNRDYDYEYVRMNEPYGNDPCAATRRAIARVAVEIGKAMK